MPPRRRTNIVAVNPNDISQFRQRTETYSPRPVRSSNVGLSGTQVLNIPRPVDGLSTDLFHREKRSKAIQQNTIRNLELMNNPTMLRDYEQRIRNLHSMRDQQAIDSRIHNVDQPPRPITTAGGKTMSELKYAQYLEEKQKIEDSNRFELMKLENEIRGKKNERERVIELFGLGNKTNELEYDINNLRAETDHQKQRVEQLKRQNTDELALARLKAEYNETIAIDREALLRHARSQGVIDAQRKKYEALRKANDELQENIFHSEVDRTREEERLASVNAAYGNMQYKEQELHNLREFNNIANYEIEQLRERNRELERASASSGRSNIGIGSPPPMDGKNMVIQRGVTSVSVNPNGMNIANRPNRASLQQSPHSGLDL
jgi:hypothetical protein